MQAADRNSKPGVGPKDVTGRWACPICGVFIDPRRHPGQLSGEPCIRCQNRALFNEEIKR